MGTTQSDNDGAQLDWDSDGQPRSRSYGDVYFSGANGLEESRYVFLSHNQLPQRWQPGLKRFCIGETGFGTGLNFLATWECWRQRAPADARLDFISVEKHPLSRTDLERALTLWPQLQPLSQQLITRYPHPCPGFHRLSFDQGRVNLTLMIGDAGDCYQQLSGRVDAWFLDGFAPSKNPEMWTPRLFKSMATLSHTGTTFSTFTAARPVRDGLAHAGFKPTRVAGFGRKRHMLCGHFGGPAQPQPGSWQQLPPPSSPERVMVLGAGIAGASCARALAERGIQVQVIERGSNAGCEGSGNPQGVLYTKLPAVPTPQSRIHLAGYLYSLELLRRLNAQADCWSPCGVLQLPPDSREQQRQQQLITQGHYPAALVQAVDRPQAVELAGIPLSSGGLWYPDGGWVAPAKLCARLLDHPLIDTRFNTEVTHLHYQQDHWQLVDAAGQLVDQNPHLVVACAASSRQLEPLSPLPLKAIRGQISIAEASALAPLNTVLCGQGYVAPAHQQRLCFGATFTLQEQTPAVLAADHATNLEQLQALCPALANPLAAQAAPLEGRTGFRCTTPDYLPLAGPVADAPRFIDTYSALRHDARAAIDQAPPLLPGLYVSVGHGSKGLTTAPLCGELIAAQLCGAPLPLERQLQPYLHPARFIIKDLKRRAI